MERASISMGSDETLPVDLFICHSSVDKPWAKKLGRRIEAECFQGRNLTVFLDEWDIEPGDNIIVKLDDALATCRYLAVVMSPEMISSEWCKAEYSSILVQDPTNRRGRLVPIRLRDKHKETGDRLVVPPILSTLVHLDFRRPVAFAKSVDRLLAKLKGEPPARGRPPRRAGASPSPEVLVSSLPEHPHEPDQLSEVLLSNLLPVTTSPKTVWSAATSLRSKRELPPDTSLPPFILREERLYAFTDLLGRENPFLPFVETSTVRRENVVDWQDDAPRWLWFIELLNLALRSALYPEVQFDKGHQRFWFAPHKDSTTVQLRWGTGSKRTVVRAPEPGSGKNWVHHAARLRFLTIGRAVYLSINPTYVFTTDGWSPVPSDAVGSLVTRWSGRERNGTVLRHVLLWADYLTMGKKTHQMPAGDQVFGLNRLPATVGAGVGVAGDLVQPRALLWFSNAELNLEGNVAFITEPSSEAEEVADD